MGSPFYFLGIEVVNIKNGIHLSQSNLLNLDFHNGIYALWLWLANRLNKRLYAN